MPNFRSYKDWAGVINLPDGVLLSGEDIQVRLFNGFCPERLAVILHDRDRDATGALKTPHIHWVMRVRNPDTLPGILDELVELFNETGIDAEGAVWCRENFSLDRVKFMPGCLRYLVHMDNPEKEAYLPSEVCLNERDIEWFNDALSTIVSPRAVIDFLVKGGHPLDLALRNGVKWWNCNRAFVGDCLKYLDLRGLPSALDGGATDFEVPSSMTTANWGKGKNLVRKPKKEV